MFVHAGVPGVKPCCGLTRFPYSRHGESELMFHGQVACPMDDQCLSKCRPNCDAFARRTRNEAIQLCYDYEIRLRITSKETEKTLRLIFFIPMSSEFELSRILIFPIEKAYYEIAIVVSICYSVFENDYRIFACRLGLSIIEILAIEIVSRIGLVDARLYMRTPGSEISLKIFM